MRLETLQTFDQGDEVRKKVEIFSIFFNFFTCFQHFFNFLIFLIFFLQLFDVRAVSHSCDVFLLSTFFPQIRPPRGRLISYLQMLQLETSISRSHYLTNYLLTSIFLDGVSHIKILENSSKEKRYYPLVKSVFSACSISVLQVISE